MTQKQTKDPKILVVNDAVVVLDLNAKKAVETAQKRKSLLRHGDFFIDKVRLFGNRLEMDVLMVREVGVPEGKGLSYKTTKKERKVFDFADLIVQNEANRQITMYKNHK